MRSDHTFMVFYDTLGQVRICTNCTYPGGRKGGYPPLIFFTPPQFEKFLPRHYKKNISPPPPPPPPETFFFDLTKGAGSFTF